MNRQRARRVAVVTGGASGLGRAIALGLASNDFAIAVLDVDEDGGHRVVGEIEAAGGAATWTRCDVADMSSVREALATLVDGPGIDVLVNNAGFDRPGPFLQTDPADWGRLIEVNLVGVLNCTYAAAPSIVERCRATGYGRIVNIASDAGKVGSLGEAVYSAAKGGVIAFTKSMARELGRDKVTVNAICPGPADTPMTEAISATGLGGKILAGMVRATPLGRMVTPEEVAAAVAFLVSDDARFVTGQALSVSGGLTMS